MVGVSALVVVVGVAVLIFVGGQDLLLVAAVVEFRMLLVIWAELVVPRKICQQTSLFPLLVLLPCT